MKEVKIQTTQEIKEGGTSIQRYVCNHAEKVAEILKVKCPDFLFLETILHEESNTEMAAFTYHEKDYPELSNSVILFSESLFSKEYAAGVIAHEMYHLLQKNNGLLKDDYAQGYHESLYHSAEIEADAFGICYMSALFTLDFKEAASILCPYEKKYNIGAFFKRVKKAKKFSKNFHLAGVASRALDQVHHEPDERTA